VLAKFAASVTMIALMLLLTASHAVVLASTRSRTGDRSTAASWDSFCSPRAQRGGPARVRPHRQPDRGGRDRHGYRHLDVDDRSIGYLLPDPFDTIVTSLSFVAHFTPFATARCFCRTSASS